MCIPWAKYYGGSITEVTRKALNGEINPNCLDCLWWNDVACRRASFHFNN